MSRSWSSESSSSANTSAACSLGSRRNTRMVSSGPSSSRNSATSTSFISMRMERSLRNCLVWTNSISCSSSYFSCIRLSPFQIDLNGWVKAGHKKTTGRLAPVAVTNGKSAPRDRGRTAPARPLPLVGSSVRREQEPLGSAPPRSVRDSNLFCSRWRLRPSMEAPHPFCAIFLPSRCGGKKRGLSRC